MANQDNYHNDTNRTYVRETHTTESSGGGIALMVGGLIVAVGFILWLVFGGMGPATSSQPVSDTTNVTIEPPAAPAEPNVTIDAAPEAGAAPEADAPVVDGATQPEAPAPVPADGN